MDTFYDYMYGQREAVAEDAAIAMDACGCVALKEHDKMFHGGSYKKGTRCRLREAMKKFSKGEKSSWKNQHLRRTSMTPPLRVEKWEKKPDKIDEMWVSLIPSKLIKSQPGDASFKEDVKVAIIKAKDRIEELKAYDSSGQVKRIVYGIALAIENYEKAVAEMKEMVKNAPEHHDDGCC